MIPYITMQHHILIWIRTKHTTVSRIFPEAVAMFITDVCGHVMVWSMLSAEKGGVWLVTYTQLIGSTQQSEEHSQSQEDIFPDVWGFAL